MRQAVLSILTLILFTVPAQALVEIRAGYGLQTPAEEDYVNSSIKTVSGFNGDIIVEIPMVPVGLGLRYEDMGFDSETAGGGAVYESSLQRTSLLVNYRFIDLFLYFGAIGSVGFVNELEVNDIINGLQKYDSSLTYSVGVEAGFSFGLFMVGAELGYMMATYEEADAGGTDPDFNMDGVYAKVLAGLSF